MKLKLLTGLLIFVTVLTAHAQSRTNVDSASFYGNTSRHFAGIDQYRTWTISPTVGILTPSLATGSTNNFSNTNLKLGYGLTIRKQLGNVVGLQFDAIRGYISGSNRNQDGGRQDSVTAFNTQLAYYTSLSAVFKLGTINYANSGAISFFAKLGGGVAAYAPKLFYAGGTVADTKGHNGGGDTIGTKQYTKAPVLTVGLGAKIKVTDRVAINVGYNGSLVNSDILDGVHSYVPGTNQYTNHKDKFSYSYVGLEFSIGKSSKRNIDWANVRNMRNNRVTPISPYDYNSRTDSVDPNANDMKNDADGDGIMDYYDKCPNTPKDLKVDASGCPILVNGAYLKRNDSAYGADRPVDQGIIANSNVSAEEGTINFDFNSPEIRSDSYNYLNSMASKMIENRKQKIQINGYASAEGTPGHNITLSVERANAIKNYLINAGVPAKQLSVKGYGETHPIADNSTEEGRAQNRRVEIKIK